MGNCRQNASALDFVQICTSWTWDKFGLGPVGSGSGSIILNLYPNHYGFRLNTSWTRTSFIRFILDPKILSIENINPYPTNKYLGPFLDQIRFGTRSKIGSRVNFPNLFISTFWGILYVGLVPRASYRS